MNSPQIHQLTQYNHNQIATRDSAEINKINYVEMQTIQNSQNNLKKNETGRLTLPDFTNRVNIRGDDRQGDRQEIDREINWEIDRQTDISMKKKRLQK